MSSIGIRDSAYLFVGGEDGETSAGGLVLVRGTEGPESDGSTTELGEPALELRLGSDMGETAHMEDLAALRQESTHVGAGVHGTGENIRMLVRGLRLADQTAENSRKSDSLLHGTTGRGGSQSLQVEGQVVLDGSRRLDGLNLEGGTDVGQGAGAEGQRLGVVCLPSLVLCAQIESARVLQVGREDNGLVASLARQLNAEVPGVESDKGKLGVVLDEVLLSELVEAVDGIAERACIANVLPCEGCKAGCTTCQSSCLYSRLLPQRQRLVLLQSGVMGVLTGFTRTLSRCSFGRDVSKYSFVVEAPAYLVAVLGIE